MDENEGPHGSMPGANAAEISQTQTVPAPEQEVGFETKPVPLLIPAEIAAFMCGRSLADWWLDDAAGRIPASIGWPDSTMWRRAELVAWVNAGCPSRSEWEARLCQPRPEISNHIRSHAPIPGTTVAPPLNLPLFALSPLQLELVRVVHANGGATTHELMAAVNYRASNSAKKFGQLIARTRDRLRRHGLGLACSPRKPHIYTLVQTPPASSRPTQRRRTSGGSMGSLI